MSDAVLIEDLVKIYPRVKAVDCWHWLVLGSGK